MQKDGAGNEGFSLVELSIVLVILGLLVGGVMGGQSLIKAAELRSVGEEHQRVEAAIMSFKGRYGQLPGDFTMATRIWNNTADGNGDGKYDYPDNPNEFGEAFTFWQHLALSGSIAGDYTGQTRGGSHEDAMVNENVMASRFPQGGWGAYTIEGYDPGDDGWYTREYGNILQIGSKIPDWEYGFPLFTPEEAHYIDSKFDDGIPSRGNIVGRFWDDQCSTAVSGAVSSTNFNAQYRLSDSSVQCALGFVAIIN